jgi:hypothetical protein
LFFAGTPGETKKEPRRADAVRRSTTPARSAAFRTFADSAGRCQSLRPATQRNHLSFRIKSEMTTHFFDDGPFFAPPGAPFVHARRNASNLLFSVISVFSVSKEVIKSR